MREYSVWLIHPITASSRDVRSDVSLGESDLKDTKTLASALRDRGLLMKGERVQRFHKHPDGRLTVSPKVPGDSINRTIVLTPKDNPIAQAKTELRRAHFPAGRSYNTPSKSWLASLDEAARMLDGYLGIRKALDFLKERSMIVSLNEGVDAVKWSDPLLRRLVVLAKQQ